MGCGSSALVHASSSDGQLIWAQMPTPEATLPPVSEGKRDPSSDHLQFFGTSECGQQYNRTPCCVSLGSGDIPNTGHSSAKFLAFIARKDWQGPHTAIVLIKPFRHLRLPVMAFGIS